MERRKILSISTVGSFILLFIFASTTTCNGFLLNFTDPSHLSISNSNFEEMLPGIFVRYSWYNLSETYEENWIEKYENASTATISVDPSEPDPTTGPIRDPYQIIVYDVNGSAYNIHIDSRWDWTGSWNSTEFVVETIVDPDQSLITNLSSTSSIWEVDPISYTGDEVYYSTRIYSFEWGYEYYIQENYTWFNEFDEPVNSVDVILAPEYEWASWYNESFIYEDRGCYSMFGFSVYQISLLRLTGGDTYFPFEIQHFFEGFSIFNDSNKNGIIDISYDSYYALGELAETALSTDPAGVYRADISELVFEVWLVNSTLSEVVLPYVDSNQIVWAIKLTNIYAELWSNNIWMIESIDPLNESPVEYEPVIIEVLIPEIEFKFRFSVVDNLALLKVDQIVGDFLDSDTGEISPEFQELSLAINYWSSVFSYNPQSYDLTLANAESGEIMSSDEAVYNSSDWDQTFEFKISSESEKFEFTPVAVEIENIYTWIKDNNEYEVGIAIVPMWAFGRDIYHQAGVADDFGFDDSFIGGTYYYSVCYINWDGYGIIHDPKYSSVIPSLTNYPLKEFPVHLLGGILVAMVLVSGTFGVALIRYRKL
ncbi:MAG: hypothetical protein EAX86_06645 [Candidatus Heimdallarchaeota archaeon]|nr:hypothetical protein [Candidatus Heimdallarchaeota archaeon]